MEICFGEHELDVERRELRRGTELVPVEPQVFDLLVYLVRNRDRVVSKDDLIANVWGGRIVSESTLTSHIHAARKAVGDSGEAQCLIRTLPRKGFRFVGTAQEAYQRAVPLGDPQRAPTTASIVQAPAPPRLSIVVLPFINLSDDREQQYFADGITEDLTTELSRLANMFVISRNTAFSYRNKPIDTRQIGRELGVRYVLEGSVRRSRNQVRVSAQLIDAAIDAHLWAERFDSDTGDLFALQDEVTSRIGNALGLELIAAETARPAEHPDALDYVLWGRAALAKPASRKSFAEAIGLFERALALDPQSSEAQIRLAHALVGRVLNSMTDTAAADLARVEGLVGEALAALPRSALAHFVKGNLLRAQQRYAEAIPEYETAIALDRNILWALNGLASCKLRTGSIKEVISLVEQAIRLSPRDPNIGNWYGRIGFAHLLQSHTDEAIVWLEKARAAVPGLPFVRGYLAAAYALGGEIERAAVELAEARRRSPDDRYSSISRLRTAEYYGIPKVVSLIDATYFAGLRKAGVPEE